MMSTDYFLVSPSKRRGVFVGCNGLSGVQSHPHSAAVIEFIRWAIDEAVDDIVLVDEHRYDELVSSEDQERSG